MTNEVHYFVRRAMRGEVLNDWVDGWVFTLDEVANNAYVLHGQSNQGHSIVVTGHDPDQVLIEGKARTQEFIVKEPKHKLFLKLLKSLLKK